MAQHASNTGTPLRVWIFDNLRTRSHIFSRLFSQHEQLEQIYHPFLLPSFLGPERIIVHMKHSERREQEIQHDWLPMYVSDTYGSSQTALEHKIAEIENSGRSAWINEHCYAVLRQNIVLTIDRGHEYTPTELGRNATYLPDWLFETCTPVLLIRHPALSVKSFYHSMHQISYNLPGDEDFYLCTTLRYCRLLFDVFESQGRRPVVVDGEDVAWRTTEVTTKVCKALGIDPAGAKEHWQPTPPESRPTNPIIAAFTKTIHESTGVERPDLQPEDPLDVDFEVKKMAEQYGEKVAVQLRGYIEDYMPDYEYLKQFKV